MAGFIFLSRKWDAELFVIFRTNKPKFMKEIETLRKLALSFPETSEQPHFEKTSFRVGKKIFITVDEKNLMACIKLSEIDQDVFSVADRTIIYPLFEVS